MCYLMKDNHFSFLQQTNYIGKLEKEQNFKYLPAIFLLSSVYHEKQRLMYSEIPSFEKEKT